MNPPKKHCLVAVAGGSGAGKTWLVERLQESLNGHAMRLSLDDFYHDRSHLPPARRARINFDHPRAIDWPAVEQTLKDFRAGRLAQVPQYDFTTHTRRPGGVELYPASIVLVDGLWLLHRPSLRGLFDLKIFVDCPISLRLQRRVRRDAAERGRSCSSTRKQFFETVAPMHDRYVAPQERWADIVLTQPMNDSALRRLTERLRGLLCDGATSGATQHLLEAEGPSGGCLCAHKTTGVNWQELIRLGEAEVPKFTTSVMLQTQRSNLRRLIVAGLQPEADPTPIPYG
jgi:uridine kinase